jgi:putative flippase GtrA
MPRPTSQADRHDAVAESRRQVGRFLVIGGLSVATDLAVYTLLVGSRIVASPLAKGVSYVAGMTLGFAGNKYWTFGSARRTVSEPILYTLLYLATLAVNVGVHAGVLALGGPSWQMPAFLAATGTTTVLNFLGMRLVTFRGGILERLATQRAARRLPADAMAPHASFGQAAARQRSGG